MKSNSKITKAEIEKKKIKYQEDFTKLLYILEKYSVDELLQILQSNTKTK